MRNWIKNILDSKSRFRDDSVIMEKIKDLEFKIESIEKDIYITKPALVAALNREGERYGDIKKELQLEHEALNKKWEKFLNDIIIAQMGKK